MRKIKVLELFAGSRSFGKAAESLGCEVFSVDIEKFDGIDLVKDVELLEKEDIPIIPDIIVMTPPCTTYSIAAGGHHRIQPDFSPRTEFAKKSDNLIKKCLEITKWFPDCLWYMENPRGMLRKMPFMLGVPKITVTYCSYEDFRMKPTDIWSNNIYSMFNEFGWDPKPMCFNMNPKCHHEYSPRGETIRKAKKEGRVIRPGGTDSVRGNYNRSKNPELLCLEIIASSMEKIYLEI